MPIGERDFGRLETKVDHLLDQRIEDRVTLVNIELRLRHLEESSAISAGRQSAMSAGVSLVVAALTAWLTKHFA
jgi:hypothetical protein